MSLEKKIIELLDLRDSAKELRRKIDYDLANEMKELLKNDTTDGRLKLFIHEKNITVEEGFYEEKINQIEILENLIRPDILKISPTINDPMKILIKNRTYINAYICDDNFIVINDRYTQL